MGLYRSHIEMLKRFKIWTYRQGEPPLFHNGPFSSIYGIEGHFMDEIERKESPFWARHPDEAHAFMLPMSVAYVVTFLYRPLVIYSREQLMNVVTDYTYEIAQKYPYWNRTKRADHFLISCHDWAPDISKQPAGIDLYKNLIRVLCNTNTSEGFAPMKDVSLPEINVAGHLLSGPIRGQNPQRHSILAFFAGGAHGLIRVKLLAQWKDKDKEVQFHEYLHVSGVEVERIF